MENKQIELKNLTGLHKLSGVDYYTEKSSGNYSDDDANCIRFCLDKKTYIATEDRSDGYRSMLESLYVCKEKPKYTFKPVLVYGTMTEDSVHGKDDVIKFYDVKSNKVVLEIGTSNADDYYPSCVMSWTPENLYLNKDVIK